MNFEIDTGSQHNVIKKMYHSHFDNLNLLDYLENNISPIDKIYVNAKYQNKLFKMFIYVIANGGPSSIGRNYLNKVNY